MLHRLSRARSRGVQATTQLLAFLSFSCTASARHACGCGYVRFFSSFIAPRIKFGLQHAAARYADMALDYPPHTALLFHGPHRTAPSEHDWLSIKHAQWGERPREVRVMRGLRMIPHRGVHRISTHTRVVLATVPLPPSQLPPSHLLLQSKDNHILGGCCSSASSKAWRR